MCEQQTECLSQLLYYDHMMNTATPTDDATAAATETTISVNEERAQIRKHNRLAATQTSFKDMAEANAGTNVKPSSGENEGIDSNIKQDASDDDNDDFQGNDDDEDDETSSRNARERLQHNPTKRRRSKTDVDEYVPMTFPQKLMEILSNEENSDIISWLPNGRGFVIHNKKRFSAELMQKYFKKSKFTSFTRKLNRWNFARVTRGPETGAYYHDYFQRDNLRLCMQMCCQSSKNPTSTSATSMTASPLPQQQQLAQLAQQQNLSQQIPPMMMLGAGAGAGAGLGQSMMMGQRSMGDAMTRLRLGDNDMVGGGGFGGVDLSATTMGMLQNQLNSQLAAFGNSNNSNNNNIGNSNEDTLFQIRQLEHQRELLLQQQQQQLQLQRMQQQQQQLQQQQLQQQLQQQQQQQLQQQQQQQQLAALDFQAEIMISYQVLVMRIILK
ncbi:hypothetical protein MHU86_16358 [Fragilaria crotonensis]|nr:hypothetical protein MHU86_16358 [Fragilaria crotonensis]